MRAVLSPGELGFTHPQCHVWLSVCLQALNLSEHEQEKDEFGEDIHEG